MADGGSRLRRCAETDAIDSDSNNPENLGDLCVL